MKINLFQDIDFKKYSFDIETYIEENTSAKLNKNIILKDSKELVSFPQLRVTEALAAIQNNTIQDIIYNLTERIAKDFCYIVNSEEIKSFSEINIIPMNKFDELKIGWIVFCNYI